MRASFRFTVRELALVTVIVAVAIAWWIDREGLKRIILLAHSDCWECESKLTALQTEVQLSLKMDIEWEYAGAGPDGTEIYDVKLVKRLDSTNVP